MWTRKRWLLVVLVMGGLAVGLPAIASSESSPVVSGLESRMWSPAEVTVSAGGTVTFQDTSVSVAHGVVWEPRNPNTPACSGVPVDRGETSWKGSCTFTKAGVYKYYCYVHGMAMSGTIDVSASTTPSIKKLSPKKGPATGETPVTVTGSNFTGATAVKFGAVSAREFVVNSATSITAVSPAEAPGAVELTVTTPAGSSAPTRKDRFTFKKPKKG